MAPRPDRRFTPSHYKFHDLKRSVRAYSKKTGKQVPYLTKKGTIRKNTRKVVTQTLTVIDKRSGELKKYGAINEKTLTKMATVKSSGRNVLIRAALEKSNVWKKLARSGANGVRVRISGKAGEKIRRALIDVVLDSDKLTDQTYIMRTVLAKILHKLGTEHIRLSDANISKHKAFDQLAGVKFEIETYGGSGQDEEGEDEEWAEESDNSTSEPKRTKKRRGKRTKSRKRKSLRSTRKTTRKGKYRS